MESIRSANISGQSILIRVDFNTPVKNGKVLDDFRIQRVLPTIQFLRDKKAKKIILISHLDQPGVKDKGKPEFSLAPVASHLEKLIREKIYFITTLIGKGLKEEIENLPDGSIVLLENIRFYKEESENNKNFAKELAKMADIFINEAFSVCHRKIASSCAITKFLPSFAGILLEEELINLNKVLKKPRRPLVVILGGVKIKDKISVIEKFKDKAGYILLGGVMANTFLKANDFAIGKSLYDKDVLAQAKNLHTGKTELILPGDFVVLDKNNQRQVKELGKITENDKILDIGPIASDAFSKIISKAKTVFFNGPMGKFEDEGFSDGTNEIINAIIKNKTAFSVIGGGETIASFRISSFKFQTPDSIFLSTLAEESLPGLQALMNNKR
jgi:phosphoglycerate kinase